VSFIDVVVLGTTIVLTIVALPSLIWMLYAWRTPEAFEQTHLDRRGTQEPGALSFSILVPARHEDAVLEATLEGICTQNHPHVQVICIVGHDDPATTEVAERVAERFPERLLVVIDHSWPKSKPAALNSALPHCTGDVVGVFDAEDEVAPGLLRAVERTFLRDDPDVVQGGVQLMNVQSSWWSARNCLEYYFWFRSRLHFHADRDFIPLGGNTVFVRRDVLQGLDGWDAECLAEDCDLGVRISALGGVVTVAYTPDLATREETPDTIPALVRQRTRWNQGFIQVMRKGDWKHLPSARQRLLARYTLLTPFIQAATGLIVPLSLVMVLWVKASVLVTLIAFLPLLFVMSSALIEMAALREFGRDFGVRIGVRQYAGVAFGTLPYQWMLAASALRAVWREARNERGWEKTAHIGAHRGTVLAGDLT
jgi:glycosyltransferase XagB